MRTIYIPIVGSKKRVFHTSQKENCRYVAVVTPKASCDIDLSFIMDREHTDTSIQILAIIGGNIDCRIRTHQSHENHQTKSMLLLKSVLSGTAKLTFEGMISIAPKAKYSDAYQKNDNLLLSPFSAVRTSPMLEIQNNDVRCSHGVVVSYVPDAFLWYCQTRGINMESAKTLYTHGFTKEILSSFPDSRVQEVETYMAHHLQ